MAQRRGVQASTASAIRPELPSYRALGWRELSRGEDAWTGFLLSGVLWALFPMPDLTAEAAPGCPGPTGCSGHHAGLHPQYPASPPPWRPVRLRWPTPRTVVGRALRFIADPEGNRWEITWAPWATLGRAAAPCFLGLRTSASRCQHNVVLLARRSVPR